MRNRGGTKLLIACVIAAGVTACSSSDSKRSEGTSPANESATEITWPPPSDPMARASAAGLVPETAERFEHHVHAHLDVFVDGAPVVVPAGIGINIDDPAVKDFTIAGAPGYGGIDPPCDQPCISPLHTHDVTGILHTESPTDVDGDVVHDDPRSITLSDQEEIAIVIGTPPAEVPSTGDFSQL